MSDKSTTYEVKDHQLFSSTPKLWRKLRRENEISPSKKKMVRKISWAIRLLSIFRWMQNLIIRPKVRKMELPNDSPVFVIGHWRSGTTHLHYLLSQDPQFSCVGSFQAFFFNIAFTTRFIKPLISRLMPDKRPQDNVKIGVDLPQEDEHAFINVTDMSGMNIFFFPKNHAYFDKYNCFDGISADDLKEWKTLYSNTLKEISLFNKNDDRLLLKNPHNTGRVEVLAKMYPNAKFVYIHRNPYDVFNSTRTLYEKAVRSQFLQDASKEEVDDLIVHCYEKMISSYVAQRKTIPSDRIIEVSYDDVAGKPLETMKKVYEQLELGDFNQMKPRLEAYLKTVKDYKVNKTREIEQEALDTINSKWKQSFVEWGYSIREGWD